MIRQIVIAGIGSLALMAAPAFAQEVPELDGAPGPLRIPSTPKPVEKPPAAKPKPVAPAAPKANTTASISKAEQARRDREADAGARAGHHRPAARQPLRHSRSW